MTQNTERTFRTREEQVADSFSDTAAFATCFTKDGFILTLEEAEARVREEQRRKDAEGTDRWEFTEPEYHSQGMGCGLEDRGIHDRYEAMEYGWNQAIERCIERIPEVLYTRPANVAALEARVKELEEAKGKKQEEARRYRNALMNICEKTSEFSISHKVARAALTREGGV